MTEPKLQKLMASLGLASRREAEKWIQSGRVSVDGNPASLGMRVGPGQQLVVDGNPIDTSPAFQESLPQVFIYHKALGEECSRKPQQGHKSVFDRFPSLAQGRWILIGRLDVNSSGLLLVTDSGELANRLMHPSREILREYLARVNGKLDENQKARLLEGVEVDGDTLKFDSLRLEKNRQAQNQWYRVRLHTGRNREVRRAFQAVGLEVSRLMRVRFNHITLPRQLVPSHYSPLPNEDVLELMQSVDL